MRLPGEASEEHFSMGDIYLPCASYEEMGEWTLPAQSQIDLHHLKTDLANADLKEREDHCTIRALRPTRETVGASFTEVSPLKNERSLTVRRARPL